MGLTDKSDIRKEDQTRLKDCLNHIEEEPNSYDFREPVPWKELGLNDYPEIIKKPMDLRTVRKNLGKGFMNQITRLVVVSWGRATRAKKKALAEQKKLEEGGSMMK